MGLEKNSNPMEPPMYIGYDLKNGVKYAKLYTSKRDGQKTTKEYQNLGRVLDKESGIYQNRERGVFTYDLATNIYGKPPVSYVPITKDTGRERLILDFGDVFALSGFIDTAGLLPAIDAVGYGNPDTLKAMLCYYILCTSSNCHANDWWEGSYARILYPRANLTSQRISEFLTDIGEENSMRSFFNAYLPILGSTKSAANILIDSTGLPNNVRFPLTAISNHNGKISNEVRLIYVTKQETGLPIFFRCCPGNVVDVSTLVRTVRELKANGVNTKLAILDAGYYSDENLKELYSSKIAFVTRLKENKTLYKNLIKKNINELLCKKNIVEYNDRYVYIKCEKCQLVEGYQAYAYVGLDVLRKGCETKKLFSKAKAERLTAGDVHDRCMYQGMFILVSSKRLRANEILPIYYTRQQIEQVFDIGKNYSGMLPLRVQGEATFRGHLLLTFIATVIIRKLQDLLKNSSYNPFSFFQNLRNQKCKIYDDRIITQEPVKKANDCYKLLGIKCPVEIPR